ncbi:hypothetical protein ACD591_02250 [Rufibacter glacialis]|uniref:Uncharacterized protein n=1 Tax=Rufibacter glacialis TaxID=1259555 RepID=A0A5M8QND6_9BACT|nr:hypothetical protein [Rufibacter glacialis]KAA6435712.1 hypothetical protein FOE74_07150 [Rufibacter glacialis]GGK65890.1 hypothetical protein GCM10011405_12280 [Rufibacter glacialis]
MEAFTPDVIVSPSKQMRDMVFSEEATAESLVKVTGLPPATTDIRFQLTDVYIKKKREIGKAEVYVLTVIADDSSTEPLQLETRVFEHVKNKTHLSLGPKGVTCYRNTPGKIPHFLDYRIMVMEFDGGARDMGAVLAEVQGNQQFQSFKNSISGITTLGAPQIALITAATDFALALTAKILKGNKDDQLFLVQGSFDNTFDSLGVTEGLITQGNKFADITYQVQAV